MPDSTYTQLFDDDGGQAVRLPPEMRFAGDRVRVTRVGRGVLIEPVADGIDDWFARLRRHSDPNFMKDGRDQPATR